MTKFSSSRFLSWGVRLFACALPACGEDSPVSVSPADSHVPVAEAGAHDALDAGEPTVATSSSAAEPEAGVCVAKTCTELGVECGRASDGCGGALHCGDCAGASSEPLGADACVARECEADECGLVADGCGGELTCALCPTNPCNPDLPVSSVSRTARSARSAGFSGTTDEYFEMYEIACSEADECVELCRVRGGTEEMCAVSECSGPEGDMQCLPTTVWSNLEGILFESDDPTQAVELTAVFGTYHDTLVTDAFEFEIPSDATILGIGVEVRRMGSDIADYSVKLVKDGQIIGGERAQPALWGENFEWIEYGGATDLWATSWTVSDLVKARFGVALSIVYAEQAGHARAYVDQVRVTIHYAQGCEG